MSVDTQDMVKDLITTISQTISELAHLNILVVGKSGVGKSTLINSVFRGHLAETGLGRPVTQEIRKIEKKGFPLTIYDTPGFELSGGQQDQLKDSISNLISDGYAKEDVNQAIHCIWYCINVGGNRTFDRAELDWLRSFSRENQHFQIPIIVVLTQAIPKSKAMEMKRLVEQENLDIVQVIPLLAKEVNFDGDYVAKPYGLDQLIEVMSQCLPEELDDTLQNMQIASLEAKKKKARQIVAKAVKAAFGEGFVPVPFADAAVLVPIQVGMIAKITATFGLEVNRSFLMAFLSSTIGTSGATVLGRTLAANLMKMVPSFGSVAGGVISGSTAAVITTALGESYIFLMEMLYRGEISKEDLNSQKVRDLVTGFFKDALRREKR